jgi:type VI secretion system protein ImpL
VFSSQAFRTALQTLRQDAAGFPPQVASLITQIGKGAEGTGIDEWANSVRADYQREVVRECVAVVTNRYPFAPETSTMEMTLADFTRIFGWNGIFDRFFNENLQDRVITDEGPWRWRHSGVKLATGMLPQFQQARFIRDLLFPQPGQLPQVTFTAMITDVDRANRRVVLQIDGKNADNRNGADKKWPMNWPASDPGYAAVTFEPWLATKRFDGPWAWLRLIQAGQPQHNPPNETVISFRQGDYHSRVTVVTTSTDKNPFVNQEWRQFRCGS